MKLSYQGKVFTGLLSILPVIGIIGYFVFFIFFFFGNFFDAMHGGRNSLDSSVFIGGFGISFVFLFLAAICGTGMQIYLIVHAAKNKQFDDNQRLVWILVLIFVQLLANPVYWYLNIWKAEDSTEE